MHPTTVHGSDGSIERRPLASAVQPAHDPDSRLAQDIESAIAHGERVVYLFQSRSEAIRDAAPVAAPKAKAFDHVVSLLSDRQR